LLYLDYQIFHLLEAKNIFGCVKLRKYFLELAIQEIWSCSIFIKNVRILTFAFQDYKKDLL